MKPPVNTRVAVVGGAQASSSFGISLADEAHIMGILRDTLYTDKVLAVLREYASNAWDAHRSVGKRELPIAVTLPTNNEPTLRIRDWGPGLSRDDVFNVYTQYGASTKRGNDDSVGMLGIGCKSGFAYSDSFTITSWHGGTKATYVAVLDESEKGAINLLDEQDCEPGETGVEIQIAIRPGDIYDFDRTARRLFRHFEPRPTINVELAPLPEERTVLTNGTITTDPSSGWIAVMGCVPYRVNLSQLGERDVSPCLPNLSGTLTFDIGQVHVNASREELKYSAATKAVLVAKFNALVDEYVAHAFAELDGDTLDGWQKRLRVQVLAKLDLPLPEKWKPFAEGFAKVTYTHDDFVILHNKAACTRLTVDSDTTLLIDDTGLALDGYTFGHDDYLVRAAGKTPDEIRARLDTVLANSGLSGVTITLLSSRYWTAPVVPEKKKASPKHRARMFTLKADVAKFEPPWSSCWEVEITRTPLPTDVYVVISGFKAYNDFYSDYDSDEAVAEAFGVTMPPVYGYKSTEKRPVDPSTIVGIEYRAWRKTFMDAFVTPERLALIEQMYWSEVSGNAYNSITTDARTKLGEALGDSHAIAELCDRMLRAHAIIKNEKNGNKAALRRLASHLNRTSDTSEATRFVNMLHKRYPLLKRHSLRSLWPYIYHEGQDDNYTKGEVEERDAWFHYVQMMDVALAAAEPRNNVVQLKSVP